MQGDAHIQGGAHLATTTSAKDQSGITTSGRVGDVAGLPRGGWGLGKPRPSDPPAPGTASGSVRLSSCHAPGTPSSDVTSWRPGRGRPGAAALSTLARACCARLPATSPRRTAGAFRRPRAARPPQACRARVRGLRCHPGCCSHGGPNGLGVREGGGGQENEWGAREAEEAEKRKREWGHR